MSEMDAMERELEAFKKSFGKEEKELTSRERYSYKRSMRRIRARYGLTDGLRCDREKFKEYLQKRREEDAKQRPGRYFSR
tara:strand:- start:185 stop:424 length:240 start_codon:yes stop_codon:yes gene_type:complete